MLSEIVFKFYVWSGSVRIVLLAGSPLDAAKRLVRWAFDKNRLAELDAVIEVSQMGFAASSIQFRSGPVLASID